MILYVKSPNDNDNDAESSSSSSSSCWPYRKKPQFVWMALEDKKSGTVLRESPTLALIAVMWHSTDFSARLSVLSKNKIVWVPSAVSRYLCRGADLMRAGIRAAPDHSVGASTSASATVAKHKQPKKNKGKKEDPLEASRDMVMICVQGNPQPFAVGQSILCRENTNVDHNKNDYGPGTKGIGVEIWSCYGDDLWRTTTASARSIRASSTPNTTATATATTNLEDGSYGNPGFSRTEDGELYIWPVVETSGEDESSEEDETENANNREIEIEEKGSTLLASPSNINSQVEGEHDKGNEENPSLEKETTSEKELASKDDGGDDNPVDNPDINHNDRNHQQKEDEEATLPNSDDLLHEYVCRALVHLGKNDLPMSVGTFYTKHVVPHGPKGAQQSMAELMKETTYKKFGNYLKRWQQKNYHDDDDNDGFGLLKTGPDPSNRNNKDPNALLISYNRRHFDLRGIKKTKKSPGDSGGGKSTKVLVVTLYVVPNHWTKLLRLDPDAVQATHASSAARKGTGMLTLPEVRKILENYLERESLGMMESSSKRSGKVVLDGPLTDALYGKGKSETTPGELLRKDLYTRFADRLSPAFCLVEMPGSTVLKLAHGKPPQVLIEVVRRQSKKFVTRLRGLEEYYFDGMEPAIFCKEVSKRLAISGSIDTDPSANGRAALPKKGHVECVFGANVVDELEALLTGDETLSDHGGVKGSDWPYPRIPSAVIKVVLRKGVPARKKRRPHGAGGKR